MGGNLRCCLEGQNVRVTSSNVLIVPPFECAWLSDDKLQLKEGAGCLDICVKGGILLVLDIVKAFDFVFLSIPRQVIKVYWFPAEAVLGTGHEPAKLTCLSVLYLHRGK